MCECNGEVIRHQATRRKKRTRERTVGVCVCVCSVPDQVMPCLWIHEKKPTPPEKQKKATANQPAAGDSARHPKDA